MAVDTNNALAWAQGICSGAVLGTPDPGAPTTAPTAPSAPWTDYGAMTQDGLSENPNESSQEFYRWGAITPFARIITKEAKTFKVTFLEKNANVLGLYYRTTPTVLGTSTNEVQTITITGTPTGGTFVLDYNGQPTTDIAYNATAATVQTALQALSTIGAGNATVSGGPGPGTPYVVTFAGTLAAANTAQLVAVGNFTGGTTPAIAVTTTTGGAAGSYLKIIDDTTGKRDVRALCFDLISGTNHERYYCPQAEVTNRDPVVSKFDDLTKYGMEFTAYPDSTGIAVVRYVLTDALRLGL